MTATGMWLSEQGGCKEDELTEDTIIRELGRRFVQVTPARQPTLTADGLRMGAADGTAATALMSLDGAQIGAQTALAGNDTTTNWRGQMRRIVVSNGALAGDQLATVKDFVNQ